MNIWVDADACPKVIKANLSRTNASGGPVLLSHGDRQALVNPFDCTPRRSVQARG
jgi:hypothetical protein